MDISTQIRRALAASGRSARDVALAAGYRSPSALYRHMTGTHEPDDATLQRYADALGVELRRPAVAEVVFRPVPPT